MIAAGLLLLYVFLYNKRKKSHIEEKEKLKTSFNEEIIKVHMEVQEQTLQTIGREIHDNIGQLLSLTRITLSTVAVGAYPKNDQNKISNSLEYLNTSIRQLRQLAAVLHAENLLSTGLEEAVKIQLESLSANGIYNICWHSEGSKVIKIDPKKELMAFRIIQEIINNIIKHADATLIDINFKYEPEGVIIVIVDNGKGFETENAEHGITGMGLGNLVKRAKMIGGDLTIKSILEKGTKVTFHYPYINQHV